MTTFVAVYRGRTIGEAKLVAVSVEPALVAEVVARLLEGQRPRPGDSAIGFLEQGRRKALQAILNEAERDDGKGVDNG